MTPRRARKITPTSELISAALAYAHQKQHEPLRLRGTSSEDTTVALELLQLAALRYARVENGRSFARHMGVDYFRRIGAMGGNASKRKDPLAASRAGKKSGEVRRAKSHKSTS